MNEDKRELAELLERHAREMAAHFLGHVNSIQDAALSKLLRTASEALTAVGAHLRARREEGRPEPVRSEAVTLRFPSDPDADKYVVTHHEPSLHGAPPVGAAGLTLKLKTGSTYGTRGKPAKGIFDELKWGSEEVKPDVEHRTVRIHTGGLYCYAISGNVSHGEFQELERPDGPPSQALNLSHIITDQSDGEVVFTALVIDGLYYHWETLLRKLAAKQTLRIEAGQRVVVRLAYLGKEPRSVSVHLYG